MTRDSNEESASLQLDRRSLGIQIQFGKSSSKYFDDAVQIASELPGYELTGEGKDQRHKVTMPLLLDDRKQWECVRQLSHLVGAWKTADVTITGAPTNNFWELERSIANVRICYDQREKSGLSDQYCSGKNAPDDDPSCFGCRLVKGVTRSTSGYTYMHLRWYQFGTITKDNKTFKIDKKEILNIIQARTCDQMCTCCPAYNWERVVADVADLPDEIKLNESSAFEIKYSDIDPAKALGIKLKTTESWSGEINIGPGTLDKEEGEDEEERIERNVPTVRFQDIAAQDIALREIKNIVQLPLSHGEYFSEIGVEPQRGVLLFGPPGNGKTLIAQAVATESNAHLELINGPELLSKWVGESENNLRKVFERARHVEPSIVLIDELDAIAPRRDMMTDQHDIRLISQLLVLLDGLDRRGRVAVIGTTNRIEAIDTAVLRPGRFDYHIEVPLPTEAGRMAILKIHLEVMKLEQGLDLRDIARATTGFSGAELAALCREAGLHAISLGIEADLGPRQLYISKADLEAALKSLESKRILEPEEEG